MYLKILYNLYFVLLYDKVFDDYFFVRKLIPNTYTLLRECK